MNLIVSFLKRICSFRKVILVLTVLSFQFVQAQAYPDSDFEGFQNAFKKRILKMRELISRDKKCVVAVYPVEISIKNIKDDEVLSLNLPTGVRCISDIVLNRGTLSESSGCSMVVYSVNDAKYYPFFNDFFPKAISKNACSDNGFDDLLQKKGRWRPDIPKESSVERAFLTPDVDLPTKFILVYAESDKYVGWFQSARERVGELTAHKNSKSKKVKK